MGGKRKSTVCTVPGCGREHFAKGYCERHYDQLRHCGRILPDRIIPSCKVPGCRGEHLAQGYCGRHYYQFKRHGRILPDKEKHTGCKVTECVAKHYSKGYCKRHYHQLFRYGKILPEREILNCKFPGCKNKRQIKGYCNEHYRHAEISASKITRTCKVPGCGKKHYGKGYCSGHYHQILYSGRILPERNVGCKVPGCEEKHYAKGYCGKHYGQIQRNGKVLPEKLPTGCKVPGCTRKHLAKGYCAIHYEQMRRHGKILPETEKHIGCREPGCTEEHYGKGYCYRHYTQIKKYGRTIRGHGEMNEIIRKGRTAEIVYENKFRVWKEKAIIDIEDLERVKKHFWSFSGTTVSSSPDMLSATLGQFIMNVYKNKKRKLVLHKNGNPLDCRKSNLVVGTRQQLAINAKLSSRNTSGHKGVYWNRTRAKWFVFLVYNGVTYHGGSFVEKEKAILSRKRLEVKYHNHLKFFPGEDNEKTE